MEANPTPLPPNYALNPDEWPEQVPPAPDESKDIPAEGIGKRTYVNRPHNLAPSVWGKDNPNYMGEQPSRDASVRWRCPIPGCRRWCTGRHTFRVHYYQVHSYILERHGDIWSGLRMPEDGYSMYEFPQGTMNPPWPSNCIAAHNPNGYGPLSKPNIHDQAPQLGYKRMGATFASHLMPNCLPLAAPVATTIKFRTKPRLPAVPLENYEKQPALPGDDKPLSPPKTLANIGLMRPLTGYSDAAARALGGKGSAKRLQNGHLVKGFQNSHVTSGRHRRQPLGDDDDDEDTDDEADEQLAQATQLAKEQQPQSIAPAASPIYVPLPPAPAHPQSTFFEEVRKTAAAVVLIGASALIATRLGAW